MNETRLRQAIAAFDALAGEATRVSWQTTAAGWELRTLGAGWVCVGATMDECVEDFVAHITEATAGKVQRARKALNEAMAVRSLVEVALTT